MTIEETICFSFESGTPVLHTVSALPGTQYFQSAYTPCLLFLIACAVFFRIRHSTRCQEKFEFFVLSKRGIAFAGCQLESTRMVEEPLSHYLSSCSWAWAAAGAMALPFVGYCLATLHTSVREVHSGSGNRENVRKLFIMPQNAFMSLLLSAQSIKNGNYNQNDESPSHYIIEQEFLEYGPRRTLHATSHITVPLSKAIASSFTSKNNNKHHQFREQLLSSLYDIDNTLEKAGMDRSNITRVHFYTTDVDTFLDNIHLYSDWIGESIGRRSQTLPRDLTGINHFETPHLLVRVEIKAQDCHVELDI